MQREIQIGQKSITIDHERDTPGGGAIMSVKTDIREWVVDVASTGSYEIVETTRGGELAELEEPEWLEDAVASVGPVVV